MSKFKTFILPIFSVILVSFFTFIPSSLANSSSILVSSSQSAYSMGFSFPFFKAEAKKLEGKSVELQGKIEGDKTKELQGKMIQTQGELMETTEEAKQVVEKTSDNLSEGLKEVSKNISGGIKETSDNLSEGLKNLQEKADKTLDK